MGEAEVVFIFLWLEREDTEILEVSFWNIVKDSRGIFELFIRGSPDMDYLPLSL